MIIKNKKLDVPVIQGGMGVGVSLLKRLDEGGSYPALRCSGCLTACPKNDSIPYCISRALIAAVQGDWENGLFFTGSNAYRVDRILPVAQLIDELMQEYEQWISENK